MKITLVRSPFYSLQGRGVTSLPLSLAYLASFLINEGHKVKIIDCEVIKVKNDLLSKIFEPIKLLKYFFLTEKHSEYLKIITNEYHEYWLKIFQEIKKSTPDLVGLTCHTVNMTSSSYISKSIKNNLNIPVVIGGVHVTALPEQSIIDTDADFAVIGEGEITFSELINAIEKNKPINEVDGIAFLKNGSVKRTGIRKPIKNLDDLPFPARELFDKSKYPKKGFGHIISGRGCPFNCIFCASKVLWTQKARFRSPENIVKELEELYYNFNIKSFRFVDDTFTLKKQRVLEICDRIKDAKLNIEISIGSRVDTIDREIMEALKEVGVHTITFGIESGSQKILNLIQKNFSKKKALKTVKLANELGFNTLCFFMVGHPTETKETIHETVNFLKQLNPTNAEVNIVTPYPGTKLWDMLAKDGNIMNFDWYNFFHQSQGVISLNSLTNEQIYKEYKKISRIVRNHNIINSLKKPAFIIRYISNNIV